MTREMNKIVEQKVQKYENEYPLYMNYDYSNKEALLKETNILMC